MIRFSRSHPQAIERYIGREMRKDKQRWQHCIPISLFFWRFFFIYLVGGQWKTGNSYTITRRHKIDTDRSAGRSFSFLSHKLLHDVSPRRRRRRRLRRAPLGAQAGKVVRAAGVHVAEAGRVPLASARRDAEGSAVAVALERLAAVYGAHIAGCCALATCRIRSSSNETLHPFFFSIGLKKFKQCK